MGRIKSKILIAAAALFFPPFTWASAASTPTLQEVAPSVFLIQSVMLRAGGSGFVVLRDREPVLVTNKHVCMVQTLSNKLRVSNETGRYIGTIEAVSDVSDLCFVRLPGNFDTRKHPPLAIAREAARVGDRVHTVGFPKLVGPFMGSGLVIAIEVLWDQIVGSYTQNVRTAFLAKRGQSGSPMLNDAGQVVGVLVAINPHFGHTFYVPLEQLVEFMKEEAHRE